MCNCLIAICKGGDDGGVFTACLREQIDCGLVMEHRLSRRRSPGEDDSIDMVAAGQLGPLVGSATGNKLQRPP